MSNPAGNTPSLSLRFGLQFADLYDREGLVRLDAAFLEQLDPALRERIVAARSNPEAASRKQQAELIIAAAPHVDSFVGALFGIEAEVAALRARLWITQKRLDEALAWARAAGLSHDDDTSYSREFEHLTFARLLIAQSAFDPAQSTNGAGLLLDRLLGAAAAAGREGAVIETLLLQALHMARTDLPAACGVLEQAITRAETEGYMRLFLDEGEPMRDLLRSAAAAGAGGVYARKLLAAFESPGAEGGVEALLGDLAGSLAQTGDRARREC